MVRPLAANHDLAIAGVAEPGCFLGAHERRIGLGSRTALWEFLVGPVHLGSHAVRGVGRAGIRSSASRCPRPCFRDQVIGSRGRSRSDPRREETRRTPATAGKLDQPRPAPPSTAPVTRGFSSLLGQEVPTSPRYTPGSPTSASPVPVERGSRCASMWLAAIPKRVRPWNSW